MVKYSKKVIFDYVTGNDIEEFNIDELEDDYEFMIEVIKFTNDKRMYDLCSDKVKNNYEFIKFMVETFKKDVDFVASLALNYLNNTDEEDITYKELLVFVSNFIGDNDKLLTLKLKREIFKTIDFSKMELIINEETNPKVKQELGMGFIFIIDSYGGSDILKNYFASEFIEKIFYSENYNLEEFIHNQFKAFDIIKKEGINTFLINYIEKYDHYLAAYISTNINLLNNVRKEIIKIGNNWNKYIENINKRRIDILNQEVCNYVVENHVALSFDIHQLIMYVMKKYYLEDIFNKYDDFQNLLDDEQIYVDSEQVDETKMNFNELKCLKYISDLVIELFEKDAISQKNIEIDKKKYNGYSKILKFSANNR